MHSKKKTMYEILEVPPSASDSDIQAAYQRLSQKLLSEKNGINDEEIEFKLKVINVAFNTLSVKRTREAYDIRQGISKAPDNATSSLSMVPIESSEEPATLKAEAMSLKAEAMSLKAEAVALRADVMALKVGSSYPVPTVTESVLEKSSRMLSPVKKALMIVGTLVAIGMVVQVMFMLMVNRQAVQVVGGSAKAEEKAMLQDYYQQTGIRVNSKAEMDLLEAANRRKEQEERASREQERAQQEQERKYERFVEESRREGERVSEDLRRAEQQAREEEEMKAREAQEEQRRKEEEEYQRIEREKERWRRTILN